MEKRRSVRIKLYKSCTVMIDGVEHDAMVNDISRVGISFDIASMPTVPLYTDVKFRLDGGEDFGEITGKCNVVRTSSFNDTSFIGCALNEISNMDYIAKLEVKDAVKKVMSSQR